MTRHPTAAFALTPPAPTGAALAALATVVTVAAALIGLGAACAAPAPGDNEGAAEEAGGAAVVVDVGAGDLHVASFLADFDAVDVFRFTEPARDLPLDRVVVKKLDGERDLAALLAAAWNTAHYDVTRGDRFLLAGDDEVRRLPEACADKCWGGETIAFGEWQLNVCPDFCEQLQTPNEGNVESGGALRHLARGDVGDLPFLAPGSDPRDPSTGDPGAGDPAGGGGDGGSSAGDGSAGDGDTSGDGDGRSSSSSSGSSSSGGSSSSSSSGSSSGGSSSSSSSGSSGATSGGGGHTGDW